MPEKTDLPDQPAPSLPPAATLPPPTPEPANAAPAVLTPEPALPDALPIPARWSQLTLAFSPAGREMLLVDKLVPEDSDDPEALIMAWQAAAESAAKKLTAEQEAARLSLQLAPTDGLLIYSAQLWKAGQPLAGVAFHASLPHVFSPAGAWDAPDKLAAAVRDGIIFPLTQHLQQAIRREVPASAQRSPRVEAVATKAQPTPDPDPEQPEGS